MCWKRYGYKWHLRKVVDPLGNSLDFTYEEEHAFVGGAGSACSNGTGYYDSATYLREVSWNQGKMKIVFDRQDRLDWKVAGWGENKDCVQAMYTKQRLSADGSEAVNTITPAEPAEAMKPLLLAEVQPTMVQPTSKISQASQPVLDVPPFESADVSGATAPAEPSERGVVGVASLDNEITVNNPGFQSTGNWSATASTYYPGTSIYRTTWGSAAGRKHGQDTAHYAYAISNHAYGYLQSDYITVTASTAYTLSAWLRGELDGEESYGGGWLLRAEVYSSTGTIGVLDAASGSSLSSTWQEQGNQITMPANAIKVRLQLYFYMSGGWVTFDDVVFKKANSASNPNLVVNGDFSSAGNWSEVTAAGFPATSFFRANWGQSAGRTTYGYSISNQAYGWLESASISVSASTSYSLTAWLRGENDSESSDGAWEIRAAYYNSAGSLLSEQAVAAAVAAPATWTLKGGNFTTPSNAASVRVRLLYYQGSGWVAFDDISLKQNGTGSNLVANGDFESTGSWNGYRDADFPATSFYRATWGTAAGRSGYGYVISNHAYGYLDSDAIAVSAGNRYLAQTYLRGELDPDDSSGCWTLRIQYYTSSGADNGYVDVINQCAFNPVRDIQWKQVGGIFTPPANTTSIKFRLFSYMNSGWLAFDDVELHTAPMVTKYYYFNGQRIAMRKDGVLTYLHSDHLGSTTLTTDDDGYSMGSEQYRAYGLQRGGDSMPTDHRFTGQKEDASGLQYYAARYYDPSIGTFVSPDSQIPDPGRVLAYNRTLYARANPLKFADPTGHSDILPGIRNPFEWLMHLLGLNTDAVENTGTPEFQDLDTNIGQDVYSVMKPAGETMYTVADVAAGFMPGYGFAKGMSGINPDGSQLSSGERICSATIDVVTMAAPAVFDIIQGGDVAFGFSKNLPGFKKIVPQAQNYMDLGLNPYAEDFAEQLTNVMNQADAIHFDVSGMTMLTGEDGVLTGSKSLNAVGSTNWELRTIWDTPNLLSKTTFYRNGVKVAAEELLK